MQEVSSKVFQKLNLISREFMYEKFKIEVKFKLTTNYIYEIEDFPENYNRIV